MSIEEATMNVIKATGVKRKRIIQETRSYKKWKEDMVQMIEDLMETYTEKKGRKRKSQEVNKGDGWFDFLIEKTKKKPVLGQMVETIVNSAKELIGQRSPEEWIRFKKAKIDTQPPRGLRSIQGTQFPRASPG